MKSAGRLIILCISSIYPLLSASEVTSASHLLDSASSPTGLADGVPATPVPSLVPRRRSTNDQKCLRSFEVCHTRTVDLASKAQDFEEQRERLEARLRYYTSIARSQQCGAGKPLSDAIHEHDNARRGTDEIDLLSAFDQPPSQQPHEAAYTSSPPTLATGQATSTTSGSYPTTTGAYNSTKSEWCAREISCLVHVRDRERLLAEIQQDLDHKKARIRDLMDEIVNCEYMTSPLPPLEPKVLPHHDRRSPGDHHPEYAVMEGAYTGWLDGCNTEKTNLNALSSRVADALARIQKEAANMIIGSNKKPITSQNPPLPTFLPFNSPGVEGHHLRARWPDPPAILEQTWNAFDACAKELPRIEERIKTDFNSITTVLQQLMLQHSPFKREVLDSLQDILATDSEADNLDSAQLERTADSGPASRERDEHEDQKSVFAKRSPKVDMYSLGFAHAGNVIQMWRDRYSNTVKELLPLYIRLVEMYWKWTDHERFRASSILAGKTRASGDKTQAPGGKTVTVAATPTNAAPEDDLLPTTLQTRTRSAPTESDLNDPSEAVITPAPRPV